MIEVRPFASLGHANHGWLNARHHFSFANYYDPARMGWGAIRVWNDDQIAPETGFPPHGHADMEIITYVRTGAITHQDSLGNKGRTEAGDVQVMSAGSGIRHAEYNLEDGETTLFQIWIMPNKAGGHDVHGATLGIVGPGLIGEAVARRGEGFGMRILRSGRNPGEGRVPLEELLADCLSTRVAVSMGTKRGKLVIEFADLEDLERLYHLMSGGAAAQAAALGDD
mgnify:CR=1 FL=1